MTVSDALHHDLNKVFAHVLRDKGQRDRVADSLLLAFAGVRKKPLPDTIKRQEDIEKRVRAMVENLHVEIKDGKCTIKPAGSSERLLVEFRHGTAWYAPWEKVDAVLLAAVLTSAAA